MAAPHATSKNTPPAFNHTQDSAPEYVEVILWHRVILALGALTAALAGTGYLLFNLLLSSPDDADRLPQPNRLAPTAAIPEPAPARATTDADALQQAQDAPQEPLEAVAAPATLPAPAAKPVQPEAATTLALLDTTTSPPTQPAAADPDRYQVKTEIFFPSAIERAMLTTLIQKREPGKAVTTTRGLEQKNPLSLHQFVDLKGRAGDTLTYTWKHNGKISNQVKVAVGADHWRNYASKAIHAHQQGQWEVEVTDNRNRLLVRTRFYVGK